MVLPAQLLPEVLVFLPDLVAQVHLLRRSHLYYLANPGDLELLLVLVVLVHQLPLAVLANPALLDHPCHPLDLGVLAGRFALGTWLTARASSLDVQLGLVTRLCILFAVKGGARPVARDQRDAVIRNPTGASSFRAEPLLNCRGQVNDEELVFHALLNGNGYGNQATEWRCVVAGDGFLAPGP